MKILFVSLMMPLIACAAVKVDKGSKPSAPPVRVSDHYSHNAVKSYDLFEAEIPGHVLMLVRLANGERFPMVCRSTPAGVFPIPQSVFTVSGTEGWQIMCEPQIGNAYGLMRLELSSAKGELLKQGRRLERSAKVPLLARPSH